MTAVIFGDNNASNTRMDAVSSPLNFVTNLNELSLGKRGSESIVDCIPKKEIVSEDTLIL